MDGRGTHLVCWLLVLVLVGGVCEGSGEGPRPLVPDAGYVPVCGDDWRSYGSTEELFAARQWWHFTRTPERQEWKQYVSLVPDKTFGQVVRMTQPKQEEPSVGRTFSLTQKFDEPLTNVWVRFRVRFSPGWTAEGSSPAGANPAYKLFFLLFEGAEGRTGIEFAHRTQYIYTNVQGGFRRQREEPFGTHPWGGRVTGEFTDGEWYEYVVHREVTAPNVYVNRFYRRQLTEGGRFIDLPWNFFGIRTVGEPDQVARPARAIQLGGNKNKSNDQTQYIDWGPWEVVDGSRFPNPYDLPLE